MQGIGRPDLSWPCVNRGGRGSLIRLETVPVLDKELALSPKSARALTFWQARPGQIVTLIDPEDHYCRGRLTAMTDSGASVVLFAQLPGPVESPLQITVFQALPEKERFELVLQKLTELGVHRIVPFQSQRSTTLQERDALQRKSHRWPDVLLRAARQCRRAMIPELGPVTDWSQVMSEAKATQLALLLYEGKGQLGLARALKQTQPSSLSLIVGPEGGFSAIEVAAAEERGVVTVSLGPRILRTETAAIVAAGVCQALCGDLAE